MSNYEILSVAIAGGALLLSICSFLYTKHLNKKQRSDKVFNSLNKRLALFLDKQLPNAHKKFVIPNSSPAIVNTNNVTLLDDELCRFREILFDYKELIGPSDYKCFSAAAEMFEDAYLDLTNIQSEHNLKQYEKTLSQLKRGIHDFIKKH